MARVNGIFNITGSLQNVSFYTVKGSDQVYVRTKGGPKKQRMKTGPEFALLRKHQVEWKGCVLFSRVCRIALNSIYAMRDFNVAPVLNGMAKKIVKLDTVNEVGERSILLSNGRTLLEGFNFNRRFPFNNVLRTSIVVEIKKELGKMTVEIPRIITSNDVYNVQQLPYFRLLFNLSCVPDFEFSDSHSEVYKLIDQAFYMKSAEHTTEWLSANDVLAEQKVELQFEQSLQDKKLEHVSFLGSVGIEFGRPGIGGTIEPVKHACCAKIIRVV